MAKSKGLTGGALIPSAAIATDFERTILTLIRKMCQETKRDLKTMFDDPAYALDDSVGDGNPASRARIILSGLMDKYDPLFRKWAKKAAKRMVERNLKHSSRQINKSLREISKDFVVQPDFMSDRLREITTASINEAVGLIKLIPQKYLTEVSGAVMRSIQPGGEGMKSLIPFLNDKYDQNIRHARLVAHDQTRKTFTNISTARLTAAGVKEFEWRHSHGGKHPRKLHEELSGKVFRYDEPPYIGDMYGQPVYGLPAQLPNCFPGSTKLSLANGCRYLWRTLYEGPMIDLIVGGHVVQATPNHPILTMRGWVPAGEIQKGDYLISSGRNGEWGIDDKIDENVATFDDLFVSSIAARTGKSDGFEFDFHGHIPEHNVDWVSFDNNLTSRIESPCVEKLEDLVFSQAYGRRFDLVPSVNPKVSQPSGSGSSRQSNPFISRHAGHANTHRLGAISQNNAMILKDFRDESSRAVISLGNGENTFSSVVGGDYFGATAPDEGKLIHGGNSESESVLKLFGYSGGREPVLSGEFSQGRSPFNCALHVDEKIVRVFSGHVYTLESYSGWFSVTPAHAIVKNCRCFARPILNFGESDERSEKAG